jgi:hypothetical protein
MAGFGTRQVLSLRPAVVTSVKAKANIQEDPVSLHLDGKIFIVHHEEIKCTER